MSILCLRSLRLEDNHFIFKLLNSSGWITFIGDRNIYSPDEATLYIQKILDNQNIDYKVIELKQSKTPIGIISIVKREELIFRDFGFALLPKYIGKGYARIASKFALEELKGETLYAITKEDNVASIKLLKKLGFIHKERIKKDKENLELYIQI
ncbi:MAG: GNAT family N-acetyltransferase [Saprospiraceae bacterium]|nr:GNAT family N-acetyltransferase [Saprospiraceae bacterium]